MSVKGVSRIEREVIMTHLVNRWNRTHLATLSDAPTIPDDYDVDAICPVLYYGQPFDPSKPKDVAALNAYSVDELKGYGYYTLDISGGTWDSESLPLNLVDVQQPSGVVRQWSLETGTGPVTVTPQVAVEDGVTGAAFDAEGHPSFTADIAASYLHGVGFITVNLAEMQSEGLDVGTRGSQVAKVMVRVMIAAAPPSAPLIPDLYAAAVSSIFRGVMWVADSSLPESDLRRDMADSGVSSIRQYRRQDPIQERANRISDHSGWAWFVMQFVVRRQYRLAVRGRQSPTNP